MALPVGAKIAAPDVIGFGMDDRYMRLEVDDHLQDAVLTSVKGLDAPIAKKFVEEGKELHTNIFALVRTRASLEKLDEAHEVYMENEAPHSMATFGVVFETPAFNLPATTSDGDEVWKRTHVINNELSIGIAFNISAQASYRDV